MLPDHVLSSQVLSGGFLAPRDLPRTPLSDHELGGTDIADASDGLRVKVWAGEVIGNDVVLSAEDVAPTTVLTVANITEFSFTFDQNMRVAVAYTVNDVDTYLYWYDATLPGYTTTQMPAGSLNPRCSIDDKRALENSTSDIILAYIREGALYFRAQRDRYAIEYLLSDEIGANQLVQIGMNNVNRFQFQLR